MRPSAPTAPLRPAHRHAPDRSTSDRRADRVLQALGVDRAYAEDVLGDLAEEYALRAARDGAGAARWWYVGEALRSALATDATDPVNGEPMSDFVSAASVDRLDARGMNLVRARVELAPGEHPGYVYDAYLRGSVTAFLGFGALHAGDVGSG